MGKTKRQPRQVDPARLAVIVERTRGALSQEDFATLKAAMDTLAFVTAELQAKGTSVERLRRLLFGAPTEKTDAVLRKAGQPAGRAQRQEEKKAPAPGHGRTAAAAYTGASREEVAHASLHGGDVCQ
ncbi:hypothetical protein HV824_36540, partial [Myxococcus sp. AM009]|uniref:hypothetical protein n=1 Tax=Myxococcus sp. AM009 TaxID=2745137 RepID=UPI0015958742